MKILKNAKISLIACAVASWSFLSAAPVLAAEASNEPAEKTIEMTLKTSGLAGRLQFTDNTTASQPLVTQKTGFSEEDGKTVYLDQFGQKVTGRQIIDQKEYLFDDEGVMQTGFQTLGDKTFYYEETGEKAQGTADVDGEIYQLQDDGSLKTGWEETEDGSWLFYTSTGYQVKDTTAEMNGVRYEFDENGVMVSETSLSAKSSAAPAEAAQASTGTQNASSYQAIANAALAQVGVYQDCTMLVTNSLRAVGINFHGWPHEYLSLGPVTNNPVPGDIIVYQGHVAIYIGDGMAVHGGWLGNQTKVSTVACTNAFVAYVHPILP